MSEKYAPRTFTPEFEEVARQETLPWDGAQVIGEVPPEYHEKLWQMYIEAFADMQEDTPTLQTMPEEDFLRALADPRVTKIIHSTQGRPDSIVIYSSIKLSPDYYPWNSLRYFEKHFPEDYEADRIYYHVGLFVDKEYQGNGNMLALVEPMFTDVMSRTPEGARFVFDCCEGNELLPSAMYAMAARYQRSLPEDTRWNVERVQTLGTQTFTGFGLSK